MAWGRGAVTTTMVSSLWGMGGWVGSGTMVDDQVSPLVEPSSCEVLGVVH